jgi:hypothetical protein
VHDFIEIIIQVDIRWKNYNELSSRTIIVRQLIAAFVQLRHSALELGQSGFHHN